MKSIDELHHLYENEIKIGLLELESLRKTILFKYVLMVLMIILVFSILITFGNQYHFFVPIGIGLIILAIIMMILNWKKHKSYISVFKDKVVRKIVEMINPDWKYDSKGRIPQNEYKQSELFNQTVDRYQGDDLVTGTIDKTEFKFSELHTEYKTITHKDGKTEEHWHTIFKGLFAHADFNKEIKGKTIVLPDTAEKLFGKWGQNLQKMSGRGQLVKLENQEFEKEFVVYGSDQIESRYILTPTMMEAMLTIKKKYKRKMYFSFIGSRVYVAISFSKNLFEPRLFSSGVKFKDMEEMNDQFSIIQTLIHQLNLNTRIWTKD